MTKYAMICDHRDYLHQWADEIIEIIPDDIVFEEESRERIVDVLKEFEFSLNRTIYSQAKAEQRDEFDILLAMLESTTEDTTHAEMLEMIKNIRKSLCDSIASEIRGQQ